MQITENMQIEEAISDPRDQRKLLKEVINPLALRDLFVTVTKFLKQSEDPRIKRKSLF